MKLDSITFKPVALIELEAQDLELLVRCAVSHYDHTCQAAGKVSSTGRVGLLAGALNYSRNCPSPQEFTWRDMDLTLKVCESAPYVLREEKQISRVNEIREFLRKCMNDLVRCCPEDVKVS